MNKKTIISYCLILTLAYSYAGAQEPEDEIRNPFTPWLPQLPPEVKDIKKTEIKPVPVDPLKSGKKNKPYKSVSKKETKPIEIKPPDLRITGLVWNSTRPQAIVNERVVDIGDSIEEAIIVAINKTGIEITFQGKTHTVTP